MTRTESKKKINIGVPLPKARDNIYTVQENKLLDQITIEISEAWSKDLVKIRESFEGNQKLSNLLRKMYLEVQEKIKELDKFLNSTNLVDLSKIREGQIILESQISSMRNEIESVKNRFDLKPVQECLHAKDDILHAISLMTSRIISKVEEVKEEVPTKKWWKFWG